MRSKHGLERIAAARKSIDHIAAQRQIMFADTISSPQDVRDLCQIIETKCARQILDRDTRARKMAFRSSSSGRSDPSPATTTPSARCSAVSSKRPDKTGPRRWPFIPSAQISRSVMRVAGTSRMRLMKTCTQRLADHLSTTSTSFCGSKGFTSQPVAPAARPAFSWHRMIRLSASESELP